MSGSPDTVTQKTEPPEWAVPYFKNYLQQGAETANQPYQPYGGQRTADLNPVQYGAMDAITNRAMQGTPEAGAGRAELTRTLSGGYLGTQAPTNSYLGATNPNAATVNPMAGVRNPSASAMNPFAGVRNEAADARNPYAGSNPYLQQSIDDAQGDVVRAYNLTAAPSYGTANARSGSFGNAGLAEMENESRRQLQGELGRISTGMRLQDYTQQQQLGENAVNRQFQSGESLASRLFGAGSQQAGQRFQAGESGANRLFGAGQQQANNLFSSGENFANRLFSGGEAQAGRQQSGYENERSRMLSGLGMVPALSGLDYQDALQMLNVGGMLQGQDQRYRDEDYGRFTEARDYPLKQLDVLGRSLGVNFGQTSQQQQPGTSPIAGAAGGAMAGSAFGPWGAGIGGLLGLLGGF